MIFLLSVNGVNCMAILKIFRQSLHSQNKFDNIQCNILFRIPASVFMREYWFVILLSCNILAMFCIGFVLASVNKLGCSLSLFPGRVCVRLDFFLIWKNYREKPCGLRARYRALVFNIFDLFSYINFRIRVFQGICVFPFELSNLLM